MYYSSKAIILRNRDYQEADRLVSVFTEQYGKIGAIAKGVKKPNSSLRACTQPFCYAQLYFYRGKDLSIITQGKLLDFFGRVRSNFSETIYVLYMLEMLDKILLEQERHTKLFYQTLAVVQSLEKNGYQPLALRYFEVQILKEMGFTPELSNCVVCAAKAEAYYISLSAGGLVCKKCERTIDNLFELSPETLALLRLLFRSNLEVTERINVSRGGLTQLEKFLEIYLEYHLEQRLSMKQVLQILKQKYMLSS